MARIPTTERKYYDTQVKQNAMATYAGALMPALQDLKKEFNEQEKIKVETLGLEARIRMNDITNQWRIDNQSNPNNPDALKSLKVQYDTVLSEYRNKIDPVARNQWDLQAAKLKGAFDVANQTWSFGQRQKNTENDIKKSVENYVNLAYGYGQSGDIAGAKTDLDQSYNSLLDYGAKNLGAEDAAKLLSNYKKAFYTNYLQGNIQANPDGAKALLENEEIKSFVEPYKIEQLKALGEYRKKQIKKEEFDRKVDDFTKNATTETYDALLKQYPTMPEDTRDELYEILTLSPNYDAKNDFDSVADAAKRISSYADETFESEEKAFNEYVKILNGLVRANKNGTLTEDDVNEKKNELASVLRKEAVRTAYAENKPSLLQYISDCFSIFSSPAHTQAVHVGKLREMATQGVNAASALVELGDTKGALKIYQETRDKMILYKNPMLKDKKIGDKVEVNGRFYTFGGFSNNDVILELVR